MTSNYKYLSGFNNQHQSEALKDALPKTQNSPKEPPLGLYAEQLSGTAFTSPRSENKRSWLYKIRPSAIQRSYQAYNTLHLESPPFDIKHPRTPDPKRWDPISYPVDSEHFIHSLITWAGHGSPKLHTGAAIHLYAANHSMENEFFYNSDAEMLIVLQEGPLDLQTEFGAIYAEPGEIVVIPRGIKFQVNLPLPEAKGYVLENFGLPFTLPDLGPIGANCLANPRDFKYPTAKYYNVTGPVKLINKFQGKLFYSDLHHNPLDVVAWHGNYAPYKYDLRHFNTIGSISFDHPDPSIFTVLTSKSAVPGIANIDFVVFPERWLVAENTFRAPYYHRNYMSEFMGLIFGEYDAKPNGFQPGGASLHNCMTGHGPDLQAFTQSTTENNQPRKLANTLAFMFESQMVWETTEYARNNLQKEYVHCWDELPIMFNDNTKQ